MPRYRALDRYEPRCRFRTWLFTIAHRLSLNHRRDSSRERSIAEPESICSPECDAADESHRRGLWRIAAEVLDAEQTACLWLHYVENLSTAEIGQVLGRSRAAVKTMLFRRREELMPELRSLVGESGDWRHRVATLKVV